LERIKAKKCLTENVMRNGIYWRGYCKQIYFHCLAFVWGLLEFQLQTRTNNPMSLIKFSNLLLIFHLHMTDFFDPVIASHDDLCLQLIKGHPNNESKLSTPNKLFILSILSRQFGPKFVVCYSRLFIDFFRQSHYL